MPREPVGKSARARLAFVLRNEGRLGLGLLVALAVPALVTGAGQVVEFPRPAIPALLYLLAVVWAVSLGGLLPGLVASLVSCAGLTFFFLPPYQALARSSLVEAGVILGLFLIVAVVFARVVARAQNERWAAQAAEERLRAIVESAPLAFILIDSEGRVRLWSPGAEQIFGWKADEVVGELLPTVPVGGWDRFLEDLARQLRGERHKGSELRGRRKDGSELDVTVWTAPFRDRSGRIVASLGIVADASEAKRLEAELRQSQKLEAVGKLAGGIAHDFNNLLTVIHGHCDVALARLEGDHPLQAELEQVQQAADRATALTRQLLAFSRKQLLQPTVVDLNEVIAGIEGMLRRLIGEDIELVTRLDTSLATVRADRSQLEQVLLNLAVNAREAMPDGGRLTIATRTVEVGEAEAREHPHLELGRYAELCVTDSGEGMPPEVKEQAFEPFFTTKGPEGTGLGLSTVYGIIRQSNGSITIESEPGEGTRFTILFPERVGVPEREERPGDIRASRPSAGGEPPTGVRVLVVEDDELLRNLVSEMLETAGFAVLSASRADKALALFSQQSEPIEVLLTDVVMPRMSGRELATRIRELDPDVQVVYTSGYADDAGSDGGESGMEAMVLPKPFTGEQLVAAVLAARSQRLAHAGVRQDPF